MRHQDPKGDYGRQQRQREVIQKVLKKILALDSVSSYKKILSAVSKNMQTNVEISSRTIPSLLGYADSLKNIETYQLEGEGQTINEISYEIVSSDHLLEVQNRIKKQLGLEESTELKTTAVLSENLYGTSSYYSSDYSSYDSGYSTGYDTGYSDYSNSGYSDYSTDTYSQDASAYAY